MRQWPLALFALVAGLLLASACGETTVSTATGPVGDGVIVAPVATSTTAQSTTIPEATSFPGTSPDPVTGTASVDVNSTSPDPEDTLPLCADLPRYGAAQQGNLPEFANISDDVMTAAQQYTTGIADVFGGLFIDRDNGGTIVFLVTDDPQHHIEELTQLMPDAGSAGFDTGRLVPLEVTFDVVQVPNTERELRNQVPGLMSVLAPGRVFGGGVDVFTNRISLDLLDPEEDDLIRLAEEVDPRQVCVSITRTPPRPDGPLRLIDDPDNRGPRELPANLAPVSVELVAAPSPTDTTLAVAITEVSCASGQPMGDRLLGPDLAETDTTILIAFATLPRMGAQNCQGNGPVVTEITLAAPVGDRSIFDAVNGTALG